MNTELQNLLHRWREGSLTTGEMRTLTALLAQPEAREALRRDWFLEAALPQALATSAIFVHTPQPSLVARLRGWIAQWLTRFAPSDAQGEESSIFALRLWARSSFAALAIALITASWLASTQRHKNAVDATSEPAYIAQIMFETQLPDSP